MAAAIEKMARASRDGNRMRKARRIQALSAAKLSGAPSLAIHPSLRTLRRETSPLNATAIKSVVRKPTIYRPMAGMAFGLLARSARIAAQVLRNRWPLLGIVAMRQFRCARRGTVVAIRGV
jgi:hypothetical protein